MKINPNNGISKNIAYQNVGSVFYGFLSKYIFWR